MLHNNEIYFFYINIIIKIIIAFMYIFRNIAELYTNKINYLF